MRFAVVALVFSLVTVPALATEPVVFFEEMFDGPADQGLAGRTPAVHLAQPGETWLADPIIAANGQVNDGAITLTGSIEGAPIVYTLDGTIPDSGSTPYGGPFPLNSSATVRAVAFGENDQPGPVAARSYTVAAPIGTPNLLVIVGDAVGFGDLHGYGGVTIATPALDSLAYDGIRFTQFTTAGPGAGASQFALLSGRVAARSGMGGNAPAAAAAGWDAEEWTLAEMLRRRGYQTAFIGEWLLGNSEGSHPNDQGFQLFHGLPFNHTLHPPLEENRSVITASPDPATLLESLAQRAVDFLATTEDPFALVFHPPALPAAGNSLAGPHGDRIEALDQAVAQLLAALDTHNLAANTLVLFLGNGGAPRTADGGSNGLFRDGAGTTWEGGLRTPLMARLPATLPAGQTNLSLVWLPDLMPTLAALVGGGLAPDRPLDGTPQPDALTGARTRPAGHETVFGYRHHNGQWQIATVRQGKWKSHLAITNIDPQNNNPTTGNQLYDLHIDAEERINRAASQPAILSGLAGVATAAAATLPAAGTTDLPAPKDPIEGDISTLIESDGSTTVRYQFARPALDKPNLVIIFLDDAGYADFSHTGHPTIETPAVSRLAAEGANFTQFYCASPACTASRYGLLTGRNPRRSGLRWVIGPTEARHIHPHEVTIAEGLKAQGYATGMFGKWHLGNPNSSNSHTPDALPLAHGFDFWIGTNVSHDYNDGKLLRSNPAGNNPVAGYETLATNLGTTGAEPEVRQLTRRYRDAAVDFIRANKDQPFLAYIAPNMPHLQIAVTDGFAGTSERGLFGDTMAEIDDLVATVRATLEEEGVAANTLMVFTSDNGHWIRFQDTASHPLYDQARIHIGSARPFRDGKGSTWEGGQRVPGIWWWPGTIQPRTVVRDPASTLDILPTAFALAGQPLPAGRTLDGRDIRPLLNPATFPGTVPAFEFVYVGFDQNLPYAARKGPWKLHTHIYSQTGNNYGFAPNSSSRTAVNPNLLFNLDTDPSERYNVAAGHPATVSDLQGIISAFNASVAAEQTFWGPPP